MKPIVIAHHLVWTCYGAWLPNDPRGSMSPSIVSDALRDLGALHYGRKRIQPCSRDIRAFYDEARGRLDHPSLTFDARAIDAIASSFSDVIARERYTCYACAIMPDHVHLVIRKHKHLAEDMIYNLQNESRSRLRTSGLRDETHPVWGGPGWKVFLDTPDEIRRTIRYVEDNPIKARRAAHLYPFVIPYDGWPLHAGHSPNSPYARRLRGEK